MTDPFLEENSFDIRGTISRLLPILLLALIVSGYILLIVSRLVPTYQEYATLNQSVTQNAINIEGTATSSGVDVGVIVFQTQVANVETDLDDLRQTFLTEDEVNAVLVSLYNHASTSEIIITSLQAQTSTPPASNPELYHQLIFVLQAEGTVPNLMRFVISSQELKVPSSKVSKVALQESSDTNVLSMEIEFIVTDGASGQVLQQVDSVSLPTPPSAQLNLIQPTPTPTEVVSIAVDGSVTPTPDGATISGSSQANGEGQAMSGESSGCGDAPATIFLPGDTAVVDFVDNGALNLLSAARTSETDIAVTYVVYDNARLHLINGPICGRWEGNDILYWYVNYNGRTGWVGEATTEDRFLCPITNPECS